MKFTIHEAAEHELLEAARYYRERGGQNLPTAADGLSPSGSNLRPRETAPGRSQTPIRAIQDPKRDRRVAPGDPHAHVSSPDDSPFASAVSTACGAIRLVGLTPRSRSISA